jgi:hypothetical protein
MVAAVAVLAVALAARGNQAFAQEFSVPEKIAGRVVQLTVGASIPDDLAVVLTVRDADGNFVSEFTEQVYPDGTFEFADLPTDESLIYRLYIEYGGIGRNVALEEVDQPDAIILDIWETAGSLDAISVTLRSTAIEKLGDEVGTIGVLEQIVLRNNSDRTFLLGRDALIGQLPRFELPSGTRELIVESNLPTGQVLNHSTGFALANAIPPGEYQIMASYLVEYDGTTVDFSRFMPLGADRVRFLLPHDMGEVSGDGLEFAGSSTFGGQSYNAFTGSEYARGDRMDIVVSDLPQRTWFDGITRSRWVTMGLPAITGIVLLGLLAYAILIRKPRYSMSRPKSVSRRESLLRKIARLDDIHESGGVSDTEYDLRRRELIDRATQLPDDA